MSTPGLKAGRNLIDEPWTQIRKRAIAMWEFGIIGAQHYVCRNMSDSAAAIPAHVPRTPNSIGALLQSLKLNVVSSILPSYCVIAC